PPTSTSRRPQRRHIGRLARSTGENSRHQPERKPSPRIPAHPCDAKKCWSYRHLGGIRMGCHIASHRVTCDCCDAGPKPSRHVTPLFRSVTDVTVTHGQREREGRNLIKPPASHKDSHREKIVCCDG